MMEEEQQGLKERSLEFKLKERKERRGMEERGGEKKRDGIQIQQYGCTLQIRLDLGDLG